MADDLLQNNGKKFLDMMERLAERRIKKEDSFKQEDEEEEEDDEDEDEYLDDDYEDEQEASVYMYVCISRELGSDFEPLRTHGQSCNALKKVVAHSKYLLLECLNNVSLLLIVKRWLKSDNNV